MTISTLQAPDLGKNVVGVKQFVFLLLQRTYLPSHLVQSTQPSKTFELGV